jgi:hypothetical protein
MLENEKAQLFSWLKTALALELGTIPPYMMALVSLKPNANRVAAEQIRSVMIEEMLHMTLVANLTNSLGGKVEISADTIPSYPLAMEFDGKRFKDRQFDINLQAFSADAIDIFMQIELPSDWAAHDQLMLNAVDKLDIDGLTIGDFYQNIIKKLEETCVQYGEAAVFSGDVNLQIGEDYYWSAGGKPIVIKDLASAKQALTTIIDQGEGTSTSIDDTNKNGAEQALELAHFYRFREIHFGRYYQTGDQPHLPPTGEKFSVDYAAVYPIITNPKSSDYPAGSTLAQLNARFNLHYTLMLIQLHDAFTGTPKALYTAIMNGMHGMVPIAADMVKQAIPEDAQGRHGTPTFEWRTTDPIAN